MYLSLPSLIIKNNLIADTVEYGIAVYYKLIPILIIYKKYNWVNSLICFCLLSRYSVILWVPLYLIVLFVEHKGLAIRHCLAILLAILIFYIIPYLSKDPTIFIAGYQHHSTAALGEWHHYDPFHRPVHLYDVQELAYLFYKLPLSSIKANLQFLQKFHLLICLIYILLLLFIYTKFRNRLSMEKYLVASLALYFTIFYSFIQIPYKYLFIIPCIMLLASTSTINIYHNLFNNKTLVDNSN